METNTQEIADVLLRLEEPFDKDEVKWLVAATSRDGRKGRFTPPGRNSLRPICGRRRHPEAVRNTIPSHSTGLM
jgi:hypothetical protein